ncbi:Gfo/Idh/MocA family protein [Pelagicoccus mobilis]|uniref:Gfo/Idh/MocA family oxidoreductase n=1 Tax=Pelagicoccus mobilis TaxID=415221 RepID=A0A934VP94_9BACT|nr:Gfo/Idh/MocA family oxidoreductase [Pelagicoccus mobilis]MBK1875303.1 Gfo/Idh/MocA family oxidoreductase [Pelagicoccus mobilis]
MNKQQTRRTFVQNALGIGALVGFPTIIPSSVLGKNGAVAPSNKVNIGVLSCGAQSGSAGNYYSKGISQIVAVCDPIRERRIARAEQWGVEDHYNDFRDVLARDDVDGVHISTPDHWHVPMSIAAAKAGKDVYCEKPLGLTIEQNLAARQITEKYDRVFQYGTQQRSSEVCRRGIELVLNGHIGEIAKIYVWAPGGMAGGSATPELPVPDGFDYDLWLGPAPEAPFSYDRCLNQDFQKKGIWYIYDYAIGFVAGWGAHPLDQLQWWADEAGMDIPVEYEATGRLPTEGLFDTVTHWDAHCRYANDLEMRFMDTQTAQVVTKELSLPDLGKFPGNCTLFMGTEGWVAVSRGSLKTSSEELRKKAKDPGPIKLPVSRNHGQNFAECIRSRKQPVSTLNSAIRSDIVSHMTDLSIRTGKKLRWDPKKETVRGSSQARKMMSRPIRAPWTI